MPEYVWKIPLVVLQFFPDKESKTQPEFYVDASVMIEALANYDKKDLLDKGSLSSLMHFIFNIPHAAKSIGGFNLLNIIGDMMKTCLRLTTIPWKNPIARLLYFAHGVSNLLSPIFKDDLRTLTPRLCFDLSGFTFLSKSCASL